LEQWVHQKTRIGAVGPSPMPILSPSAVRCYKRKTFYGE